MKQRLHDCDLFHKFNLKIKSNNSIFFDYLWWNVLWVIIWLRAVKNAIVFYQTAFWILFAIIIILNWKINQLNIKYAFLNAFIDEEIYI